MKSFVFCGALVAALAFSAPVLAAPAGHATEVEGTATLVHGKASSALKKGDLVEEGDVIETVDKSRVKLVFEDQTELVIANKGKLTIDQYVYDPAHPASGKSHLGIAGLAFSYVGGLLDKVKNPDVKLDLDFGSIGIRGTKIYRSMNKGECWIYVERGNIDVSNKAGSVHLKEGEGTILKAQTEAPAAAHIWSAEDIAFLKSQVADPRLHKKDWK